MASHSYGNASSQLEQQPPSVNNNICESYASFNWTPNNAKGLPSQREIGGRPSNKIHCNWPQCLQTFTRPSDLARHRNNVHHRTKQFWCTVHGCKRSKGYPGRRLPFSRKDKRDDHLNKVHKVPELRPTNTPFDHAYNAADPAYHMGHLDPTTVNPTFTTAGPVYHMGVTVDPTFTAGPVYHMGLTVDPTFVAGPTYHPNPTTASPAHFIGGPTNPVQFGEVGELGGADATYITGCAGSTIGGGLAGSLDGEGLSWFPWRPDGLETAGLASFNGLTTVDGPDVSSCATAGTLTNGDAFDCFASGSMFNDFGSVDTATGLHGSLGFSGFTEAD